MGMDAKFAELDLKMEALRSKMAQFPGHIVKEFQEKLDFSWIFHDNALEGVVLSFSELKAAIDTRIISDVTLIPTYEEVRNHKLAVDFVRENALARKPLAIDLDLIRRLYAILTPEAVTKGCQYRKDNPLHRLYYHEIAAPEKIAPRMKKLGDWMASTEFRELHPINRATKAHYRLLSIYPWTKNSGRVARMLMNNMLLCQGYLPAVIHSIDRQRYYEVLRAENDGLLQLIVESLENSIATTTKFFDELKHLRIRRAS